MYMKQENNGQLRRCDLPVRTTLRPSLLSISFLVCQSLRVHQVHKNINANILGFTIM